VDPIWHSHRRLNRLQSALLILSMLGIAAMAGSLLLGETGAWLAAGVALMALLIEPTTSSALTLRLYRTRPLHPAEAPGLWACCASWPSLPDCRPCRCRITCRVR